MGWIFTIVLVGALLFSGQMVVGNTVLLASGLFAIAGSISLAAQALKPDKNNSNNVDEDIY